MTLREALSFQLPNGRTIAEASTEDWMETARLFRQEAACIRNLDPADVSFDGGARIEALLARDREFSRALKTITDEIKGRLTRRGAQQRTWLSVRSFGFIPTETRMCDADNALNGPR